MKVGVEVDDAIAEIMHINMGVEPKIGGKKETPPNHPLKNRVWNHYFHHPFWGVTTPYFWFNTHMFSFSRCIYYLYLC